MFHDSLAIRREEPSTFYHMHSVNSRCHLMIASFLGSHLTSSKNKNRGGESGIDSHMISWHDNVIAIIAKVMTQLCSHMLTQTTMIVAERLSARLLILQCVFSVGRVWPCIPSCFKNIICHILGMVMLKNAISYA